MRPIPQPRAGFTMAQLLIVILVVATLVGVLIPVIQDIRAKNARTTSTNNLKAIGLAGHEFHDANKRLPFNGSNVAIKGGPYSLSAVANQYTSGSWGFQIAPYVDQKSMFASGRSNEAIWTYLCPARGRASTSRTPAAGSATPPWSDYVINPWLNDPNAGGGLTTTSAFPDIHRTFVGITDGTSNTIFFGHGQIKPADYSAIDSIPGYLGTILIGGTTATALSSNPDAGPVTFARDSADTRTDAARGFGSPFPQGCLMCMCDATVRMFPYAMDLGTFKADGSGDPMGSITSYLTPTGGEVITLCDY
jgi:type II secretory pathway pseudopilin PulG